MAASASCASLMKWFRTLRSQIGLSGVGRLGWVHSNTINRKASNPVIPDAEKKGVSDWWNSRDKEEKSSPEQGEPLIRGRVASMRGSSGQDRKQRSILDNESNNGLLTAYE